MQGFKPIDIFHLNKSATHLIGKDWMLITAGNQQKYNSMTANWGSLGYLWNKPVAFIFVRPQRYTFELLEQESNLTLSFYSKQYREALTICGAKSGRSTNKMQESGLTPCETINKSIAFKEASIILECSKLYTDFIKPELFTNDVITNYMYKDKDKDFHKMYIVEIITAWENENNTPL